MVITSEGNLFPAGKEKIAPGDLGVFQGYYGFERCSPRFESPSEFSGHSPLFISRVRVHTW